MPRHYKLNIFNNSGFNTYLNDEMFPRNSLGNKINHVITNMTVNHDPNGVVSLHGNGAPFQTNLSISFQETEFVTSKDSVDDRFEDNITRNFFNQAQAEDFERRVEESGIRQTSGAFLEERFRRRQ